MATQVVTEIQKEAEKAKQVSGGWNKPSKSDTIVTEWVTAVSDAIATITELITAAKSSPRVPNGKPPAVPAMGISQNTMDRAYALNKSTTESAQVALEVAQKGYHATQETYKQAGDKVVEVQNNFGNLRGELAKLGQEEVTLVSTN